MLVLSRKLHEKVFIGDGICVTVVDIDRGKIRLGIEAPKEVLILREELKPVPAPAPVELLRLAADDGDPIDFDALPSSI